MSYEEQVERIEHLERLADTLKEEVDYQRELCLKVKQDRDEYKQAAMHLSTQIDNLKTQTYD